MLYFWGFQPNNTPLHSFDYSETDSIYNSSDLSLKNVEKRVDSKQELLDFSVDKSSGSNKNNQELLEKSININTADIKLLMKLPGIGIKTAEKIVQLRNKRGGFTTVDELIDVKGIGNVKMSKIRKYIFVEKSL